MQSGPQERIMLFTDEDSLIEFGLVLLETHP
jgi:hypothetical protein